MFLLLLEMSATHDTNAPGLIAQLIKIPTTDIITKLLKTGTADT